MDNARTPDRNTLRSFGLVTGLVLAVLFGMVFPWLRGTPMPRWPWMISGPIVAAALAAPSILRGIYRVWMGIGHILGYVNTRILLGAVFFLVFTPIGLLMRLLGRDPLARRLDPEPASYRIRSGEDCESSMEVPF